MTRDEAWEILCEYTKSESLRKHGLAVEAAMRYFAARFEGDEEIWAVTGLLHDFDYERDPDGHPQNGKPILEQAGVPGEIVHAIQSHGDHTGVPRVTPLEKTLYAVDELCGFVTAVALVKPVSREMMLRGAQDMDIPFDELVGEVVRALDRVADRLGLAGVATV
ncbi:MAG: HDIG domain-containing protein [Chloroflexi bacterium]|nr:MAG: HDIG domain-containing protein [Chloroflexota bacterium]